MCAGVPRHGDADPRRLRVVETVTQAGQVERLRRWELARRVARAPRPSSPRRDSGLRASACPARSSTAPSDPSSGGTTIPLRGAGRERADRRVADVGHRAGDRLDEHHRERIEVGAAVERRAASPAPARRSAPCPRACRSARSSSPRRAPGRGRSRRRARCRARRRAGWTDFTSRCTSPRACAYCERGRDLAADVGRLRRA